MLDLKLDEWCKIPLYDNIQRKTKKEMIKLLEDCGFVRAIYHYGGKDDHWTVPALLDYRAPIEQSIFTLLVILIYFQTR